MQKKKACYQQIRQNEVDNMVWKDYGELFQRNTKNPILTIDDWPYRAHSVFNPAAAIVNGTTLLMVRVEDHRGFSHFTGVRTGLTDGKLTRSQPLCQTL
jgi:predicted GH43/DUF377 family glycosyl hydrolase